MGSLFFYVKNYESLWFRSKWTNRYSKNMK